MSTDLDPVSILYRNEGEQDSETFGKYLENELYHGDNLEIYVDCSNFSQTEKQEWDSYFRMVLGGLVEEGHALMPEDMNGQSEGDNNIVEFNDPKGFWNETVKLFSEYRDSISSVDTGPVLDEEKFKDDYQPITVHTAQVVEEGENPSDPEHPLDEEQRELFNQMLSDIGTLMHIDRQTTDYLMEEIDNPENTLIIHRGYTKLDRRLRENGIEVEDINTKQLPHNWQVGMHYMHPRDW